jgi:hypothetical protein
VDTVYGFVMCGPKCKDLESDEYAVGLLKMTSPRRLGVEFEGEQYTRVYKTNDNTGLQLLVHFCTEGNVSNMLTALQDQREKEFRAPCLFAVPRSLWKDTDGRDGRELVMGGTCAIVFRVSFDKLGELLVEVARENDIYWKWFLTALLKSEGKKWKNRPGKVYVKVRTRDTTAHFQENFFYMFYNILQGKTAAHFQENVFDRFYRFLQGKSKSEHSVDGKDTDFLVSVGDFFETYIVAPYGSSSFCLCVMADRGVPFNPVAVDDRNDLKKLLRDLKVKIMGMATVIFHGDVLKHNIVHNKSSQSLHLVDFDESTGLGKKVPRRSLSFTSCNPWFEALLYPNALRQAAESYTRVQFTASVLLMLMLHVSAVSETLNDLIRMAKKLGQLLGAADKQDTNWQDETAVPDEVKVLIKGADDLVDGLLTEYSVS